MNKNTFLKNLLNFTLPVIIAAAGCRSTNNRKPPSGAACSPQQLAALIEESIPEGWNLYDHVQHFTAENLYEAINGRAEYYLSFNVTGMTRALIGQASDETNTLQVSIFDMGTPRNAFGVFSGERTGGMPQLQLGREAYRSGANHYIWKGRYYIRIVALDATDVLKRIGCVLAERVTGTLHDAGEPVWGRAALPETGRIPHSVRFFQVDAMGLDFMRNTYTAEYKKGKTNVTVFLSKQDTSESAKAAFAAFKKHVTAYGEGIDATDAEGMELTVCDMGRDYDVVFQKGRLVAGVTQVEDRNLAVASAADLWRQLKNE